MQVYKLLVTIQYIFFQLLCLFLMSKINTIIYDGPGGERVDVYLTKNHEYTRNFFHRLVARGDILVNDVIITKKSLWLKLGDKIDIIHPERYMDAEMLGQSPALDLQILLEKEDYMVIYKPKWVLSHPNSVRWVEYPNVVGALYHYFKNKNLPTTGNFIRAGLIHRLDKETDGLMLIVKTEKGLKYFKHLFQSKSLADTIAEKESIPLKKFYRTQVLVTSSGQEFLDTIRLPHTITEIVVPKVPHYEPKMGITKIINYELEMSNNFRHHASLEIEILTGRTHQIRYHLSTHGLPVRWDYLYMDKSNYNPDDRLHLTAYRLMFEDIDGEMVDVQCECEW